MKAAGPLLPSPPPVKDRRGGGISTFANFISRLATHDPSPATRSSSPGWSVGGFNLQWLSTTLLILVWVLVYYLTSTASTVWNKQLVDDGGVSVTVLTLLHLLVSLGSDIAIIQYGDDGHGGKQGGSGGGGHKYKHASNLHKGWDILVSFAPISIFLILSKLTTYVSYKHVSVSLSHTAKASEPIFNVLVAAVLFKEYHATPVYYSLLPIAVGVTLASATDFSFNFIGFFWSVVSALMKVLQNIYTKKIISSGRFSFFELHMWCGAASLAVLLPIMTVQGATSSSSPFSHFPVFALLCCSLLQYVSSISSYKVLHLVSHLTFTIVNVCKRLVVIIGGALLASQALGKLNTLGVVLAVVGILSYNVTTELGPAVSSISGPRDVRSLQSWIVWVKTVVWKYNHLQQQQQRAEQQGINGNGAALAGEQQSEDHATSVAALKQRGHPPDLEDGGVALARRRSSGEDGLQQGNAHSTAQGQGQSINDNADDDDDGSGKRKDVLSPRRGAAATSAHNRSGSASSASSGGSGSRSNSSSSSSASGHGNGGRAFSGTSSGWRASGIATSSGQHQHHLLQSSGFIGASSWLGAGATTSLAASGAAGSSVGLTMRPSASFSSSSSSFSSSEVARLSSSGAGAVAHLSPAATATTTTKDSSSGSSSSASVFASAAVAGAGGAAVGAGVVPPHSSSGSWAANGHHHSHNHHGHPHPHPHHHQHRSHSDGAVGGRRSRGNSFNFSPPPPASSANATGSNPPSLKGGAQQLSPHRVSSASLTSSGALADDSGGSSSLNSSVSASGVADDSRGGMRRRLSIGGTPCDNAVPTDAMEAAAEAEGIAAMTDH